ncbi:hydantoinase B/oxoprolinase family protein [Aeromicrobium sp. 9AM]|uniref:hydantoinase B/oxoprolinase family protein n=1 Tax=Aeromicrobium sp. 9AM TaxID=2653126 RepID=UPI0012F18C78|nr:hydantoinase B/oxoprolinase family protein [Aeromicrobium sp. 9AM]VXB60766.1 N-methylhydantoinase B [Aeromicrobium sp. 9AM]
MTIAPETTSSAAPAGLYDTIRYGLIEIAREMNLSLMRSAFSPVVRDILDCTTAVHLKTEHGWEMVACFEGCMQHAFTSQHIANFTMDEWDLDRTEPGDVIFVNDPWRGAIHQSDVNLLRPIHIDGEVRAVLHSTSHVVDLGGPIPGGFSNGVETAFEEQLKFPPTLLYADDVPVRPAFNYLLENTRVPSMLLGDIRALYGCLVVGEGRLRDLLARYGTDTVFSAAQHAIDVTEASMRAGIRQIPDGDYRIEDFLDDDGVDSEPLPMVVTVKVRGDSMEIDFSGTGRQPRGNVGTAWVEATRCIEAVKMLVDPEPPVNSGTLRPIETILPPGSAVCVLPPSSCSNHMDVGSRSINMVVKAISGALVSKSIAADSGTCATIVMGGIDMRPGREGNQWGSFAGPGGGWGGTWKGDGLTYCIAPIGNCRTSVHEHAEAESPTVVGQMEVMPDSAGAGKHRGGFGGIYTMVAMSDTLVTITSDRVRHGADGVVGGGRGMSSYAWYIPQFDWSKHMNPRMLHGLEPLYGAFDENGVPSADRGSVEGGATNSTGKLAGVVVKAGDALRVVIGGGGGWGDPLERDLEAIANDVRDGLYSAGYAAEAFGVVFEDGEVRDVESRERRRHLAAEREAGRWTVPSASPTDWIL